MIQKLCRENRFLAYADDIAIVTKDENEMRQALKDMKEWEKYGLAINPAKSNVLSDL